MLNFNFNTWISWGWNAIFIYEMSRMMSSEKLKIPYRIFFKILPQNGHKFEDSVFFCIFCNFANSKRMCSSISASFYLANLISNIVNIITIYNCWHTPDLSVYILIRIQFTYLLICGSYFGKWWLVYPIHFYQYTIKYQSFNASVAQWGARQSHNLRVVCLRHFL